MTLIGQQAQQPLPDTPKPQLTGVGPITPGQGASQGPASSSVAPTDQDAPATTLQPGTGNSAARPSDDVQKEAPDLQMQPEPGTNVYTLPTVGVNFVEVPFTVKEGKGTLVAGLDWRDIRVFEDGVRQHITLFSADPVPLSVAFVIDQSLPEDVMKRVNESLGALQGAFTQYDEIALFTYNNGPQKRTEYTGAQSARINAVIERSKTKGREQLMYSGGGPMQQTTNINGRQFDPNTAPVRNSNSTFITIPKEIHTLNDAIDMAARSLADRPKGRRRLIFVVSDGKENGSKAKFKDVVKYLQTNNISVYATLVGDSATYGVSFLDRFHLPYTMRDNLLPQYVAATGGQAISGFRQRAIEDSFNKIAVEVRTQYTVGYYSHTRLADPRFRSIELRVTRPGLDVIAKKGYYPTPQNIMRMSAPAAAPTKP